MTCLCAVYSRRPRSRSRQELCLIHISFISSCNEYPRKHIPFPFTLLHPNSPCYFIVWYHTQIFHGIFSVEQRICKNFWIILVWGWVGNREASKAYCFSFLQKAVCGFRKIFPSSLSCDILGWWAGGINIITNKRLSFTVVFGFLFRNG